MNQFERFNKEYEKLREDFDLLLDFIKEPAGMDPTLLLSKYGIAFIELLKKFVRLSEKIILERKNMKDNLKRQISIFTLTKKMEYEKEGKKATELILESLVNQDDEIFNQKLELNKMEALEVSINNEIKVIYEIIQMIKKVADARLDVDVKLGTNFEIGS